MMVLGVRAAITEAGFDVRENNGRRIFAEHADARAKLVAHEEGGRWAFTLVLPSGALPMYPRSLPELIYLLTQSLGAGALRERRI